MRKGIVGVVVLVIAAGTWSPARAAGTPAQKCAQSKLKATGKKAAAKLKCYKKAVGSGVGVDSECLTKAEDKFMIAFQKAEAKGGCATVGDAGTVEGDVDTFVANTVAALPGGATEAGQKCAASKLDATGKKANAKLKCHAKAAGGGLAVDTECLGKAEAKFGAAFSKAETKGGCATTGDSNTVELMVDAFVNGVVASLSPTTTTTSTTTSTTSTTMPAPVSFAADVQPIFTANCVPCHTTVAQSAGLDLSAGNSYAELVNVTAAEAALMRVLPGDPANSYLYRKITNAPGIIGQPMPFGAFPMPQAQIDTIGAWILQGALNN
jgi:hypothetical protein